MVTTESNTLPVFESNYTSDNQTNPSEKQAKYQQPQVNTSEEEDQGFKMTNTQTLFGAGVGGIANSNQRRSSNAPLRWHYNAPYFACGTGGVVIASEGSSVQGHIMDSNQLCKLAPFPQAFDANHDYTSEYNSWITSRNLVCETSTQRQTSRGGRRVWEHQRVLTSGRIIIGYGRGTSLKQAKNLCDYAILQRYCTAMVQMDGATPKESVQGLALQESDQASNTIVTRDEAQTVSDHKAEHKAIDYASSETTTSMEDLTARWMPLKAIEVRTDGQARGYTLATYYLPETLYAQMGKAPNLLPFETFIYGKYDIEMKFVVNANKFQCGKVLVAAKFDSYQADNLQSLYTSAIQRPHVILDMATNVEGVINVPFRYHRTMVRNIKNDNGSVGVRPSKYATVTVQILSPLTTGKDGQTNAYIRPFVKIKEASFAAMSYRVSVQMDTLAPMLKAALPTEEVRQVLGAAERVLKTIGNTANRDKPTTLQTQVFVPHPRLNFGTGKGLIDANPLKNNPYAMTSFAVTRPEDDEPKTVLDIARIWGLRTAFTWKADAAVGQSLCTFIVDPTVRDYTKNYTGAPTPLEYITGMYAFWAGTIEIRLDFVSNAFHTGAVMLAAEFGRPSADGVEDESMTASTYTKTFHLGEQKSVTFTVPYIYDTVWRRSNTPAYSPLIYSPTATDNQRLAALGIRADSKTVFRVRVINDLRPVQTAPQDIDVLVFWRASPNFMVHGIKQSMFVTQDEGAGRIPPMDNFPKDYPPVVPGKSKRDVSAAEATSDWNEWGELTTTGYMKKVNKNNAARTQADEGEKEAEDSTDDFRLGKFNLGLQTTDSQVSIKDILRRPVLLVNRVTVKGYNAGVGPTGYFIPLMPPCREMAYNPDVGAATSVFCKLVGSTPQAALINLFRFWRGSMRYTIIVEDSTEIVYITHVPHTGSRIMGNFTIAGSTKLDAPIYASGLTTDIVVPHINPTMVYEAPYDTENDWTLISEEDAKRNYSWRDKGDTNAGHIVLAAHNDFTVSIWWSAGDDFELSNFYGTPKCLGDGHMYMFNDSHARVQADEGFQQPNSSVKHTAIGIAKSVAVSAATMLPTVGSAIGYGVMGYKVNNTCNNVDDFIATGKDTLKQVQNTIAKAEDRFTDLTGYVQTTVAAIMDSFKLIPTIKTLLENTLFDMLAAYIDRSWTMVGMGICRTVYQVLGCTQHIMTYAGQFASIIKKLFENTAVVQADDTTTLVGVIVAVIGSALSISIDASSFTGWCKEFGKFFLSTKGVSYMNNVLRFVSLTFECFKSVLLKALGMVDPEIEAIRSLSQNSTIIRTFIEDAQICLNEANTSMLHSPAYRLKFWRTTLRAYQIQKSLALAGRNVASPVLAKLCADTIKTATEKFVDLSCSPVRYEPFVICIEGDPGIGKSYITERIVKALLDGIGYNQLRSGRTYTRAPGSKFWGGYRDQPCIVYDDWMNLKSSTVIEQALSELYQMKSTSQFRPEMASVEEKKISANPIMVVLLCNGAFPTAVNSSIAAYPEAVWRRRDIVVKARLTEEFEERKGSQQSVRGLLTPEESETLAHLEFDVAANPSDSQSYSGNYRSYNDFLPWLLDYFKQYHHQEQDNVKARLRDVLDAFGEQNEMMTDPFELLYTTVPAPITPTQNAYLPSEQLEIAVNLLCNTVEREIIPNVVEETSTVVQADLGRITKIFLRGVLFTPRVMMALISTPWEALMKFAQRQLDARPLRRGPCTICMEEDVDLAIQCVNDLPDNPHTVCVTCVASAVEAGSPVTTCPVCRNSSLGPAFNETGDWLVRVMIWIVKNGRQHINPFITVLKKLASRLPVSLLASIQVVMNLFCAAASPEPRFYDAAGLYGVMAMTDYIVAPRESWEMAQTAVNAQADFPQYSVPSTSRAAEPVESVLELPFFREDLWEQYTAPMRTTCMHAILLREGANSQYEYDPEADASMFKVAVANGNRVEYVYIPDGRCCEECPFGDQDRVKEFMLNWRSRHGSHMRATITAYHNAVDPTRRQMFKAKVPKLIRPVWMESLHIEVVGESWWEWLSGQYEKYKTIINICIGISAAAGSLLALRRVWSAFDTPALQGNDPNYNHEANFQRRMVTPRRIQPQRVGTQAETLDDIVRERIMRNYVIVKCWDGDKLSCQAVLLGVAGHIAVMPKHYIRMLQRHMGNTITLEPALYTNGTANHLRQKYNYDAADFIEMSNTDLAFFTLPNTYPCFRDIRSFIQTEAEAARPYPNEAELLLVPTRMRNAIMIKSVDLQGFSARMKLDDVDGTSFWATDLIEYSHSEVGACGSVLMVNDSQHPIRAIHVAGTASGTGYGVLLTKELLDELPNDRLQLQYEVVDRESMEHRPDAMIFDLETRVDYLGALPKAETPFSPIKSKIRPSNIAALLPEALTQPAILSTKDKRYTHPKPPLYYGAAKHGKTTDDFTTTQVESAREAVWDTLISRMKPGTMQPKRLTIVEAVTGFDHLDHYEGIKLDTSAGFPWGMKRDDSTKRAWITLERNEHGEITKCEVDPELEMEINRKEALRKQGIVPETIFVDTLKDERKKESKLMKPGGTRVFCACPVDYTVAMRQNLLHFCAAFMKARFGVCSAVGINAKGPEWTELYRKLTTISPINIITMDYSNFGPAFNAKISQAATDLMVRWTMEHVTGVDELELRALLQECTTSVHCAGATVYRQFAGSPSGAPITTIINTLVNLLYLHVAWEELTKVVLKNNPNPFGVLRKNVSIICYGDDFIASVTPEFAPYFNTNTLRTFFASYKIAATSADKELEVMPDFVPITKATFLKRGFRQHDTRSEMILGHLDLDALSEIPKWIWQCADKKAATRQNVESALMEAHAHGPEYFTKLKDQLNKALIRKNIEPVSLKWTTLDNLWFADQLE